MKVRSGSTKLGNLLMDRRLGGYHKEAKTGS